MIAEIDCLDLLEEIDFSNTLSIVRKMNIKFNYNDSLMIYYCNGQEEFYLIFSSCKNNELK